MKKLLRILPLVVALIGQTHADDLANVSLSYCNTSENILQYQINPGVETGICYTLSNGSKTPLTVKLSFIDGTFTNDQRQNKACLSDADVENFGRYVTNYDQLVTLNPGETIQKEAKILYPTGMDGLYHGCVVYSVVQPVKDTQSANTSFSILMRRAKFIDVLVGNPSNAKDNGIMLEDFITADGENLSHNSKIRVYKDSADNKYVVQIKVKNISRVEQNIVITGVASNIITYKNTFIETRKILKGESLVITKKLDSIPSYNLKVKFNISSIPFVFGSQEPIIGITQENTILWILNIITYLTLAGILLFVGILILIIKDIRRRGKKGSVHHEVHKHTTRK